MDKNATKSTQIGEPDAFENKSLRRAGGVLVVADLLWIPQAALIAWALADVLARIAEISHLPESARQTGVLLGAAAGVTAIAVLRVFLQTRALNNAREAAADIQTRARADLLQAAVSRSPSKSFPASGAFAAHVTDQVEFLGPYYRNYLPQLMRLKLVPIGIVIITMWFSWIAALILLISGPLIPLFMALIGSRAKAASAEQQEELTRLSGMLLDRIRGLETLTLFGAVEKTKADIKSAGERFRVGTMRVLKVAFLSSTVLELFSALGIAFVAVYVGFSLLGDIDVGAWGVPLGYFEGLFILLLAPEFFAPLRAFSVAYHDRAAGISACRKLSDLLTDIASDNRISGENTDTQIVGIGANGPPSISFENVSLCLSGRKVLDGLCLRVHACETLLLSGGSGSGKTTLIDCVLGFQTPDSGRVLLDETDIRKVARDFRQNVMWLGQAPRLFHGSLKSNLLKGVSDPETISDADIWQALRLAGAAELVQRLPRGLATHLGEDGFGLSVGEIRRIALARAAIRKSAPLLLADEPTAGLDNQTAKDVINGLKTLAIGRTALIATHDPEVLQIPGQKLHLTELRTQAHPEPVS